MPVILKNQFLTVKILQKGAEVVSVVNSEQLEYLWNGDPKHWKRHAPLLFPIVGRLQDDQYQYDGTIYKMYQHGFARDSNFEIESQSDTQAVFLLRPNATIKKHYPFNFRLYVTYQLLQDTLAVSMLVKNDDQHSMYFSIGAHPAFRVPLEPEHEQFSDYQVEVLPHREYSLIQLNQEGLTTSSESVCGVNTKKIGIMHCLFKDDAKIFDVEPNQKTTFRLTSQKSRHGVSVTATANQYFGLWSTYPLTSDFVCIEPWWGIADSEHSTGFLRDKQDISRLQCGEDFLANFKIKFF